MQAVDKQMMSPSRVSTTPLGVDASQSVHMNEQDSVDVNNISGILQMHQEEEKDQEPKTVKIEIKR